MFPALQPSRPKPPQQQRQPTYVQQQTRAVHSPPHLPPQSTQISQHHTNTVPGPRSQIEAMPPFGPSQPFYDSATRHPVFFTTSLRKLPFPVPNVAAHGWSPVASGYILEQPKAETNAAPKTKL